MEVKDQDRIIFIGEFRFPEEDAAAIRTLSLARICRDLGFNVTVIGKGRLRPPDYDPHKNGYYIEGIHYLTMNPHRVSMRERLLNPLRRIRLFATTLDAQNLQNVRAIIINASDSARHVPFVIAFCRKKSIPLIGDICEWYDPRQLGGRLNPFYTVFCLVFRFWFPRFKNAIVVSKLLERRFEGNGRNLVRIPTVYDVSTIPFENRTSGDRLVLLYAGMAGKKDILKEFIEALASLSPKDRSRIEFRLLGPTRQELINLFGGSADLLNKLGDIVKPCGRVPHAQVLESLQEAHFALLLRPDMRYANAGFPGKVPESLAAGAPMLLNFTSDLKEYLGDETAALAVENYSPPEVAKAIHRVLKLTPAELQDLRRCARAKAEQYFDYRKYLDSFRSFLEHLR